MILLLEYNKLNILYDKMTNILKITNANTVVVT